MNKHIVFGRIASKKTFQLLGRNAQIIAMSSMAALLAACTTDDGDAIEKTAAEMANLSLDGLAGTDTLTITASLGAFNFSTAGASGANVDNVENIIFGDGGNVITGFDAAVKNVTGGTGVDNITVTGMAVGGTISLGNGADILNGLTKTFVETSGTSLVGGVGTDRLAFLGLGASEDVSLSNVSGFEVLTFANSDNSSHTILLSDGITTINANTDNAAEQIRIGASIAQAQALTSLVDTTGTGIFGLGFTTAGNIDLTGLTTLTNFDGILLPNGTNNLTVNSSDADKIGINFLIIGGTGVDTLTVKGGLVNAGDLNSLTGIETIVLDSGADGITLADAVVGLGKTITIDATAKTGALTFDGSGETNGTYTILASNFGDTITGGAGADTITGGTGDDTINGGAGDDTINGGAGADSVTGGDGADLFMFDAGSGITLETADTITDYTKGSDRVEFGGDAGGIGNVGFKDGTSTTDLATFITAADAKLDGTFIYYLEFNIGGSGDAYLVYDRDGNGAIDDGDSLLIVTGAGAMNDLSLSDIV